jgi:putative isomerase
LLVGAADESKAAAMAAHLSDPSYLKVPYGVPTVSSTSKEYNPEDYWRGPVWIVTNAFVIWALEQYGLEQEALALRSSTLAMIAAEQTPREYYNSQTGAGLGATDFMWSGVFYLLLSGDISPADVL